MGHSDYHYSHEPILYGYMNGGGRRGRGGAGWYGDNAQKSVIDVAKPSRSEAHPTMKPVALVSLCLVNSSPAHGIVLDPFAGSGSTLIASEQIGRRCRAIELDPRYVDVIVDRWETLTGHKAELQRT
jgi:site-specific DNA-methyltransferase (adenine-specific)